MEAAPAPFFSRLRTPFPRSCRVPRDGMGFDRSVAAEVSELIVSTPSPCSHRFPKFCSHQVQFSLDSVRLPDLWRGRAAPKNLVFRPKNPVLFIWGIFRGLCSQLRRALNSPRDFPLCSHGNTGPEGGFPTQQSFSSSLLPGDPEPRCPGPPGRCQPVWGHWAGGFGGSACPGNSAGHGEVFWGCLVRKSLLRWKSWEWDF